MLLPLSQFLRQKKHYEKNIFIFDKDGTITAPNKPLEKKYSECLAGLLEEKQVIILTARDFSICKEHILDVLPEKGDYSHLIFACINGSEIYKFIHDSYTCISSLPGNIHEHIEIIEKYIQKINSIENTQLFLEKRSDSMLSLICMPREASLAERRDFDPDRVKRGKIIKQLLDLLPTLEILPGGSTSIDISLYSKYDGLQHIYKELGITYREALYFGDNFENDGNDVTILRDPIEAIEVSSYENLLESFSFDATPKKRVVTIGGGNGHSNMLAGIHKTFEKRISLSSIVSMSDDGRTTGRLMRFFKSDLSLHFPPPGDLRRCLYFLSNSEFSQEFQRYFEEIIPIDKKIAECSLGEIAKTIGAYDFLKKMNFPYFDIRLNISDSLEGHKFGNIFMGFLFHHFNDDYDKMIAYMHDLLCVHSKVIPVTTDSAYIQATLKDGSIVERQDNISNVCGYTSPIVHLSLMQDSRNARHQKSIDTTLTNADYIILSPGDLYTSTISNLIIGDVADLIKKSDAKILFIANTTNKGGETFGYTILDFVSEIEKYLGRKVDIIIANSKHLTLTQNQESALKNNISVKGGEYIFIQPDERMLFMDQGITIIEGDILDRKTLYKHDPIALAKKLEEVIFCL